MKTLADLTPEELANTIGMWCQTGANLGIIRNIRSTTKNVTRCAIYFPALDGTANFATTDNVVPRFDLPRAWAPDGTPPKGDWQQADHEHHDTHAKR